MLFVSCATVLDDDAILECCVWTEEKIIQGHDIVLLFDDTASRDRVQDITGSSPQLHCLHLSDCSSLDDLVVFIALFASRHGRVPESILSFTGSEFQILDVERERGIQLLRLLGEINNALDTSDPDRARNAFDILRATLQTFSGTLSAKVYRRTQDCKLLIDLCRKLHFAELQDKALSFHSKAKPFEIWRDFFPLLDVNPTIAALTAWSEITPDLERLRLFIGSGKASLSKDNDAVRKGQLPRLTVLLWLAAYLIRVSEQYLARGDGAAAIAASVRALESYINFRLFERNLLNFDHHTLDISKASPLFDKYRNKGHGDGVRCSLMVLVDPAVLGEISVGDVEEVIRLRNKCTLAHDMQRLSVNNATQALARVKSFIKQAETKMENSGTGFRWENLRKDSFLIDWPSLGQKAFQAFLP